MKVQHFWAALLTAAAVAAAANDEPLSLKGYVPGAPQSECPEGTVSQAPRPNGSVMCAMGSTTIASRSATLVLTLSEGRIVSVFAKLEERGQFANTPVRDALFEKFGAPTKGEQHLNRYAWRRGGANMFFDGWAGSLIVTDEALRERLRQQGAKKGASDL